ncbi:MAG TPA: hypothetical protein VMW85_04945 [Methanomassiliicoccales archaeon]|nr:hypothetical protein [Methanomassiliicoccales archaeon]
MDDSSINKGGLVRTLTVNDPSIKRKKIVLNANLLYIPIVDGMLLYTGLYLVPEMWWIFLAIVPILTVAILVSYMFLKRVLGSSFYPVSVYSNGVDFPQFLFNKLIGRPSFMRKEDIVSIWTNDLSNAPQVEETRGYMTLSFKTSTARVYETGIRSRPEIESVVEWIERNWELPVESGNPSRSVPSHQTPRSRQNILTVQKFCSRCGKASDGTLSFCPHCGTNFDQAPKGSPADHRWQSTNEAANNPHQRPPADTYPTGPVEYPSQYSQVGYGQMTYPNDKDPRFAFILGLALGFLGFMGIGHIYMGKVVKGLILLIVGGFLAMFSLVAISMLFGPSEFELSVRMVTTAIMSVPYLLLQLWQAFDAPKPEKRGPGRRY